MAVPQIGAALCCCCLLVSLSSWALCPMLSNYLNWPPSPTLDGVVLLTYTSFVPLPPRGWGSKYSVHIFACVCMFACTMSVMCVTAVPRENWTDWTEVWHTNSVVCQVPIALGSPCCDANCGRRSENVRGVTQIRLNLFPKWNATVSFRVIGASHTPVDSSKRADSIVFLYTCLTSNRLAGNSRNRFWKEKR